MKCSSCGKQLSAGAKKCPRCGKTIESSPGPIDDLPTSTMQLPEEEEAAPGRMDQTMSPSAHVAASGKAMDEPTSQTIQLASPASKSPDQTFSMPGADAHPPPSGDTGRRMATVINQDSQSIKRAWRDLAGSNPSPLRTYKADQVRPEAVESMVIQRRTLKTRDQPGSDHADYQLLWLVGEGGMGTVYEAIQSAVQRKVAVKTLKPDFAKRQSDRTKFLNEAKITGDLDHPNIVPIHDLGISDDGTVFYSMKMVGGVSWEEVLCAKSRQENLTILLKVCDAVAFAHSRNVIHRDLKPENIMLGEFGEVLVMDWGLAVNMERSGDIVLGGTPAYMAPEMATHDVDRIGFTSDIYLLAAMLYEVVAGFPPHPGQTVTECVAAAARNELIPVEIDDELLNVALVGMATNPRDRFQNVGAVSPGAERLSVTLGQYFRVRSGIRRVGGGSKRRRLRGILTLSFFLPGCLGVVAGKPPRQIGPGSCPIGLRPASAQSRGLRSGFVPGLRRDGGRAPLYQELRQKSAERATRLRRLKIARAVAMVSGGIALLAIGVAVFMNRGLIAQVFTLRRQIGSLAVDKQKLESDISNVKASKTDLESQKLALDQQIGTLKDERANRRGKAKTARRKNSTRPASWHAQCFDRNEAERTQ